MKEQDESLTELSQYIEKLLSLDSGVQLDGTTQKRLEERINSMLDNAHEADTQQRAAAAIYLNTMRIAHATLITAELIKKSRISTTDFSELDELDAYLRKEFLNALSWIAQQGSIEITKK